MGRNAARGANRTMTFGTGSQLKKPDGLSIDVDEDDDNLIDEHGKKGSSQNVNSRTYTAGGMRRIEKTSTTPSKGSTLASARSSNNPLSESHRATPVVTK